MKILYEIGDKINFDFDGTIKEGIVVDVNVMERPHTKVGEIVAPSYMHEASYTVKQDVNDSDLDAIIVSEGALRSPLHPETLKFYEEEEGLVDMIGWRKGLEARPDNSLLPEVLTILMAVQYDKEGFYGSSWKGKGEYRGIMSNIDRKYDRLDNITQQEIEGKVNNLARQEELLAQNYDLYSPQVGEGKVDAIADLANYSILYLSYVKDKFPHVFRLWVEKNLPPYLAERMSFLSTNHSE